MENTHYNKRQKWINIGGTALVIIALFAIAYRIADRFGSDEPAGAKTIELIVPDSASRVFIDGKQVKMTEGKDEVLELGDLSDGEHSIIVAKDNFWPWSKKVDIGRKKLELRSFAVPMKPQVQELAAGSSDYNDAVQKLNAARLPVPNEANRNIVPLRSKSGDIEVTVDGNIIQAEWVGDNDPDQFYDADRSACEGEECTTWAEVIDAKTAIRSVDFFRSRDDVLLFATGDSIYAIELDKRGTQNFQPIYKGTAPTFVRSDDNFIYVRDAGKVLKVLI